MVASRSRAVGEKLFGAVWGAIKDVRVETETGQLGLTRVTKRRFVEHKLG